MDESHAPEHRPEDRQHFHRGQSIFKTGDLADHMYVVLQGEVETGVDDVKETIGPGSMFGELGLLEGSPRVGYATALTEVHLLPIDEAQFMGLARTQPVFAFKLLKTVLEQVRRVNAVLRRGH